MRRFLIAAFALAATPVSARDIAVKIDEAIAIRLPRPAAGIVVGNPMVAGVSVQDSTLLFVTGRAPGETNLIVVDAAGKTVLTAGLKVSTRSDSSLTLVRGAGEKGSIASYSCQPTCRQTPTLGDTNDAFDDAMKQLKNRASAAEEAAGN